MKVEVFLTGNTLTEEDVKGHTVIVIDVLRTSSTIVTALSNGARAVVPAADMAEAGKIAANLDQSSFLMGGERGGDKIEGYHLGNSPLEYTPDVVEDKTLILNTTNGTAAIANARAAEHLVVGCFLNARRVVDFAREQGLDVVIVCAGWRNRIALEDTLCAGLLLHLLWDGQEPAHVSDSAHIAFTLYRHDGNDLFAALRRCNHAQRLYEQGFADDVAYCARVDYLPVLPYFEESRLVRYDPARAESALSESPALRARD
ncbi:2-phosphosulfolactate phosphatase [Rhodocaloribacter litoris]|uniref:2-phosphosulfolactate phosphatase n=1 Tax=Rhodocaloribacter litoris TaxID=2558931 RepID=UPI00142436B2|nr:2-phosphosulfolactate phosphatase [Rhodocaloribacter litoris]QXD14701.1 2-phosphosulfolactate phosphatase [Rhodocaloribacter litoris]